MASMKEYGFVAMITGFLVALLIQGIQAGEIKSFAGLGSPEGLIVLSTKVEG